MNCLPCCDDDSAVDESKKTKEVVLKGYTFHEKLGEGAFGTVHRITNTQGESFACKTSNLKISFNKCLF